jgi:metal-sulfur cluster biosynthetic enzyme
MISKNDVIECLKNVEDPELRLDIWFLGLIYSIDLDEVEESGKTRVTIEMTFTSPACPMGPSIVREVKEKILVLEGVESVHVTVVFNPPWKASEEVRLMLGM